MVDSRVSPANAGGHQTFKEAVCIDAARVYDSCSDKDCLEDLRVYFSDPDQRAVNKAVAVKGRGAELVKAYLDVEPVQFNRGFYSVDITYVFRVTLETYDMPVGRSGGRCDIVHGYASFNKRVILFGSEGNIKIFSSDYEHNDDDPQNPPATNLPKAVLEAIDPIFLSARLVECDHNDDAQPVSDVPEIFASDLEGECGGVIPIKFVLVTLGVFSIVKIERQVQMLIPAYDFCMPDKECTGSTGDPCELFRSIKFPTNEFFPPRLCEIPDSDPQGGCGCGEHGEHR